MPHTAVLSYNAIQCWLGTEMFSVRPYEKKASVMKDCMDLDVLHSRIHKVIGQCNGIDRMIERDVPCEDILLQVSAAKSALHKVGQMILEGHLRHCVREGIENGNADETIAKFAQAIEYFCRMKK